MMAEVDYPKELPRPQRADHESNSVSPFIVTPMASGSSRHRLMFESVPAIAPFTWLFKTDGEAALFEGWFRDTVKNGTIPFNIYRKTPIGKDTKLVCKFAEMYKGPVLTEHNYWIYTANLLVVERPLIQRGYALLPSFVLEPNIFDIAMNREWPEA